MSDQQLPTILIVDDSQTTRAMIKRIISMIDLPVEQLLEASDGAEALELLKTCDIHLVLADLNMPVMDGFEMIETMRNDNRLSLIPVVVISSQPDPDQAEMLKRHGIAGYLPKPFTPEAIRNMIVPLLEAAEVKVAGQDEFRESFNLLLAEALAEALETMAFISPELVPPEQAQRMPLGSRLIEVHFHGQGTKGSLEMAASPVLGEVMASNVNATHLSAADDALKELANITCGLLLRKRPGGGVGFHLAPPTLSSITELNAASIFKNGDPITLQADGEFIAAEVITDAAFYGAE